MAPRKPRLQPKKPGLHIWKIALPFDVAERVRAEAAALGKPQNRVIIDDLADIPGLKQQRRMTELLQHHEVMLERYGARVTGIDLTEKLLAAVDAVVQASGPAALESALERLRIERRGMLAHQASRELLTGSASRKVKSEA